MSSVQQISNNGRAVPIATSKCWYEAEDDTWHKILFFMIDNGVQPEYPSSCGLVTFLELRHMLSSDMSPSMKCELCARLETMEWLSE